MGTSVFWVVIPKTLYLNIPVAFAVFPDLLVVYESRLQPLDKSLALQLTAVQVALTPSLTENVPVILNLNKTSPLLFLTVFVFEPVKLYVEPNVVIYETCFVMVVVTELPSSKYSVVWLTITSLLLSADTTTVNSGSSITVVKSIDNIFLIFYIPPYIHTLLFLRKEEVS